MFCPDLILLNIMLHEIDGFSLAELIKSNPNLSNIPIIFLVPSPTDKIISHTFEAGAVDYIKIPFNDRELLARIKTQIDLNFSKKEISQKIDQISKMNEKLEETKQDIERYYRLLNNEIIIAADYIYSLHSK